MGMMPPAPGSAREHASSTRLLKDTGCQRGAPRTGSERCPSAGGGGLSVMYTEEEKARETSHSTNHQYRWALFNI